MRGEVVGCESLKKKGNGRVTTLRTRSCDVIQPFRRIVIALVLDHEPCKVDYLGRRVKFAVEVVAIFGTFVDKVSLGYMYAHK